MYRAGSQARADKLWPMPKRAERDARESRLASGWTVEADPSRVEADPMGLGAEGPTPAARVRSEPEGVAGTAASELGEDPRARQQLSAAMLVLFGVIGGLYLLYTAVWFSWAKYYADVNAAGAEGSGVLGSFFQQALFWAAPFAPALWFALALLLNRLPAGGVRRGRLLLWLLVGAVILVPLPVFGFGAAS